MAFVPPPSSRQHLTQEQVGTLKQRWDRSHPFLLREGWTNEPIKAWRAWRIIRFGEGQSVRLLPVGLGLLSSVGRWGAESWGEVKARCVRGVNLGPHHLHDDDDDVRCYVCGYHAWRWGYVPPGWRFWFREPSFIYGEVELYGTVVEHQVGYRAEYAKPVSLWYPQDYTQRERVHVFRGLDINISLAPEWVSQVERMT